MATQLPDGGGAYDSVDWIKQVQSQASRDLVGETDRRTGSSVRQIRLLLFVCSLLVDDCHSVCVCCRHGVV